MRIETEIPFTLGFVKELFNEKLKQGDHSKYISAVCTDSRLVCGGELFIGLKGERYDGSDFIKDVKESVLYSIGGLNSHADITLSDPNSSLLLLANAYKKLLPVKKTVAITGSVGKTTTKDILTELLSSKFKTHCTYKNLNNEFGVPFTVLNAPADTEILIIEAGMNHSGEIEKASLCVEPDISVITKIGNAHIGNLGSVEKIRDAKCEILYGMQRPFAIIPHNEPLLTSKIGNFKTVSTTDCNADYYLYNNKTDGSYNLKTESNTYSLQLKNIEYANFHVTECLAFALSVCCEMNIGENEIIDAIRKIDFSVFSKIIDLKSFKIINDSYNSSPEAVLEALKLLSKVQGKKSAVLGDMLELGNLSEELHFKTGLYASSCGLDKMYLIGKYAKSICKGAVFGGFDKSRIFVNEDAENPEITAEQISEYSHDEVLLFKASRKIKLERIINILKKAQT